MTNATPDLIRLHHADKGQRRREELAGVSGFEWMAADSAHITLADRTAMVRLDAAGDLRLTISVDDLFDPNSALEFNGHLPGNLRFALAGRQCLLVADMRSDDPADVLEGIAANAQLALQGNKPQYEPDDDAWEKDHVIQLLHSLSRHEDSLVELEEGWEYRPRVAGQPVAVKLNLRGGQLHCHRSVMQVRVDAEGIRRAVAIEALRFNARVKHARLARVGERLVAETWLNNSLFGPAILENALRAVAVVQRRAHPALAILANEDQIAKHYSTLFDYFEPTPTSC